MTRSTIHRVSPVSRPSVHFCGKFRNNDTGVAFNEPPRPFMPKKSARSHRAYPAPRITSRRPLVTSSYFHCARDARKKLGSAWHLPPLHWISTLFLLPFFFSNWVENGLQIQPRTLLMALVAQHCRCGNDRLLALSARVYAGYQRRKPALLFDVSVTFVWPSFVLPPYPRKSRDTEV